MSEPKTITVLGRTLTRVSGANVYHTDPSDDGPFLLVRPGYAPYGRWAAQCGWINAEIIGFGETMAKAVEDLEQRCRKVTNDLNAIGRK